jgi:hypothetical protein
MLGIIDPKGIGYSIDSESFKLIPRLFKKRVLSLFKRTRFSVEIATSDYSDFRTGHSGLCPDEYFYRKKIKTAHGCNSPECTL